MYKLYQTSKKIPWITPSMENVPNKDITDDYFNFEEVNTNVISFSTWNKGSIICKDRSISYFKVHNTIKNTSSYWYVSKVLKVLKEGFELEINLDVYMTYTRHFLTALNTHKPLIERIFFNRKMFKTKANLRKLIYYSFRLDDEVISQSDFSPKDIRPLYTDEINTQFPWDATPSQDYTYSNKGVELFKINQPVNDVKDNHKFTQQYGLYVVMLRAQDGIFDLYPINELEWGLKLKWWVDNNFPPGEGKWFNNYTNLMKYIVGRKDSQSTTSSNLIQKGFGMEGVLDITKIYQDKSFMGIYRAPLLISDKNSYKCYVWFKEPPLGGFNFSDLLRGHYYVELNPQKPITVKFPKSIEIQNDLIETYIENLQPILWGKNEIFPIKLFSYYENNSTNNDSDSDVFYVNYNVTFLGEFLAIPESNEYVNEDDMVSFGGQLVSASQDYVEQIRRIQQTYDTGLSQAKLNALMGIPAALGKGAASGLWGITSIVNTGFQFGRDVINLKLNKKNALTNLGANYITSNTSDWFYYSYLVGFFKKMGLASDYAIRPNILNLKHPFIQKVFTEEQKEQLRFILTNYGFPLNMCVDFKEWYDNLLESDTAFIKFNNEWINSQISIITQNNLTLEEQVAISEQLTNGIKINMGWK